MDLKQLFPSWKVDASEFQQLFPHGTALTVSSVESRRTQDEEEYLILYFEELKKPISLNKTNAFAIADIAGTTETDHWPGVVVKMLTMPVEYNDSVTKQRKMTLGFRVFQAKPNERPTLPKSSDLTRMITQQQRGAITAGAAARPRSSASKLGDDAAVGLIAHLIRRGRTWDWLVQELVKDGYECGGVIPPDADAAIRQAAWGKIMSLPLTVHVEEAKLREQLLAAWYPPEPVMSGEVIDPKTSEVIGAGVQHDDIPF